MKKEIIYVDFTKKRRINFFRFTFNKLIRFLTHKKNIQSNEIYDIDKNNKPLANKIYYL